VEAGARPPPQQSPGESPCGRHPDQQARPLPQSTRHHAPRARLGCSKPIVGAAGGRSFPPRKPCGPARVRHDGLVAGPTGDAQERGPGRIAYAQPQTDLLHAHRQLERGLRGLPPASLVEAAHRHPAPVHVELEASQGLDPQLEGAPPLQLELSLEVHPGQRLARRRNHAGAGCERGLDPHGLAALSDERGVRRGRGQPDPARPPGQCQQGDARGDPGPHGSAEASGGSGGDASCR
jgi:hypothetical protein